MRASTIFCGGLLCGLAGSALACDLPKLVLIPTKQEAVGKEAEITSAMNDYSQAIDAYVACVVAELNSAGGQDRAPEMIKRILIGRNNTAVAEKEFMIKLYQTNVGAGASAN